MAVCDIHYLACSKRHIPTKTAGAVCTGDKMYSCAKMNVQFKVGSIEVGPHIEGVDQVLYIVIDSLYKHGGY